MFSLSIVHLKESLVSLVHSRPTGLNYWSDEKFAARTQFEKINSLKYFSYETKKETEKN